MNRILWLASYLLLLPYALSYGDILTVTTEGVKYLPYQPIYINMYYEGEKRISLTPGADEVKIHVRYAPTGQETEYISLLIVDKICEDCLKSKIAPTEIYKVSNVLNIACDARGWLFEKPGEYTVWISLTDEKTVSNIKPIIIGEPNGQDAAVAESIRKCPKFSIFEYLEGGDMFGMALATAKTIADGNSGYRACMRDLLVKNYCQQSCSPDGVVRLSDLNVLKQYYDSESFAKQPNSKLRTLTLMGRFSKAAQDDQTAMFVKSEFKKLKTGSPAINFEPYLNKKFVE